MQREQTLRTSRSAASRAANELVEGRSERERAFFHVLAQRIPGLEAMFARDHRLCVVQGETGVAKLHDGLTGKSGQQTKTFERACIAGARSVQQRLGKFPEMLEIRTLG
jgi:hypothetical protein